MEVYALKNTEIKDSASGGAFPTIVSSIKEIYAGKKIVVYGALFDDDLNVKHARAKNSSEEIKFRGSKYIQSNMSGMVKKVEEDLKNDNIVVFSGTPCQNYAIKNYVESKNLKKNNLILIEIICHGVTNPIVWNDFKQWIEKKYNSKLIEFSFRYQKAKWKVYPVKAVFENGKVYINSYKIRQYIKLFFSHHIFQERCYECKFANLNRVADITLGDFWGIEEVMPSFKYKEGVSEVLVNTDKGKSIIKNIYDNNKKTYICIEECKSDKFIKYQHNLQKPTCKPQNNDMFWKDYNDNNFEYILRKYIGYGFKGKVRHLISRFMGETGIRKVVKLIFKR